MSNELAILQENEINTIQRMANAVAKSKLFGMETEEQAMALMLIAQAEGQHPALAARDYHIIKGKPTLKADAMLARFQQGGGRVEWHQLDDMKAEATFSHPQGGSVKIDWDKDRAHLAGLLSNPTWQKYPRQMLRARVISEGIRTVFPGVAVGVYTPEEAQDFEEPKKSKPEPKPEAIDVESTPIQPKLAADDPVLVKAVDEAKKGTESFKAWWSGNRHVQKDLKPHKDELKAVAALADKMHEPKPDRSSQLNDEIPEFSKAAE